jgi:hypothetical protein
MWTALVSYFQNILLTKENIKDKVFVIWFILFREPPVLRYFLRQDEDNSNICTYTIEFPAVMEMTDVCVIQCGAPPVTSNYW